MNIRDLLRDASFATDVTETNMFDMEYTEQSITVDGNILGGADKITVTYIKAAGTDPGYFSAVSTKYTQAEQPFIQKYVDSADNTAEVVTSKSFGGGFNIEDRPLLGEGQQVSTTQTDTGSTGSSY